MVEHSVNYEECADKSYCRHADVRPTHGLASAPSLASAPTNRRGIVKGAGALIFGWTIANYMIGAPTALARTRPGPGARYLLNIKADMLRIAQRHSARGFLQLTERHADLPAIGSYCLGEYAGDLPRHLRRPYRKGLARYMARYFTIMSRKYAVRDVEILDESVIDDGILVQTRIHLASGTRYSIGLLLSQHGRHFRIRDAKLMGFWLSYFQKRRFVNFIGKHDGNVEALIQALRR